MAAIAEPNRKIAEKFIREIIVLSEKKRSEYKDIADGRATKKIRIYGLELPEVDAFYYKIPKNVFQYFAGNQHRNRTIKVTYFFEKVPREDRLQLFAETGAEIFYSFQCQLNQTTDKLNIKERGVKMVAEDARDRAFKYLAKRSYLENEPSCEALTRAVISGRPKSFAGHRIKLAMIEKELYTDALFNSQGNKVMQSSGELEFYIRASSTEEAPRWVYQYRFPFDWEEELDWKPVFVDIEALKKQMSPCEFIEKPILKEIAQRVLREVLEAGVLPEIQQIAPLTNIPFNFTNPRKHFSGRDKELEVLHNLLKENIPHVNITQCAVITGLGGVGKSELARMYASKFRESYEGNIVWINSETESSRENSFKGVAPKLGVPTPVERDILDIMNDIYEKLSNRKCLIIFDNARNFEDIKTHLPKSGSISGTTLTTLITSRSGSWQAGADGFVKKLPLDVLTEEEALSFVKKTLYKREITTTIKEKICDLTKLLSKFPLALRVATANLNPEEEEDLAETEIINRIEKYIEKYNTNDTEHLDSSNPNCHITTVYMTWRATFELIRANEDHGRDAIDLMEMVAYCRPDSIAFDFGMKRKGNEEIEKRRKVWKVLSKYSLISIDKNQSPECVSVHKLVQEVVRMSLTNDGRAEAVLRRCFDSVDKEEGLWDSDVWNYASEHTSLIDDFAITNQFRYTIYCLMLSGRNRAVDRIIDRLKEVGPGIDWQELLYENEISEDMITGSEHFNELARHLCLFYAHFHRNLPLADKLDDFDQFLENFSERFEKKILLETRYDFGYTPLHIAARHTNYKLVEWLLHKGADLKALNSNGETVIHCAAEYANREVLTLLVKDNEDWNCKNDDGRTPLFYAVDNGNLDAVKFLLEIGADPNAVDHDGKYVIHKATELGDLNTLRLIVKNNDNLEAKDSEGRTPLQLAVEGRHFAIIKFLLGKSADPTIADNEGRCALHLAVESWDLELLKLFDFDEKRCNFQSLDGRTALHFALNPDPNFSREMVKAKPVVEFLLQKKANPLICDDEGRNAFWYALRYGYIEVVQLFIERNKLKISTKFKNNQGVLHAAVPSGNIKLVNKLLDMRAKVNCADSDGITPLHLALNCNSSCDQVKNLACNHVKVAKLLIEKGARKNYADNDGVKLIHLASKHGKLSIVKLCDDSDYQSKTKMGWTPLHYAAAGGRRDVIEFLLEHPKVNANEAKMTPAVIALGNGHTEIVKYFLDQRLFNVNAKLPNRRYPLQLALDSGDYDLVRFLIDQGANRNPAREDGVKAVHLAAKVGDVDFLKRLADDKNELKIRKCNGQTMSYITDHRADNRLGRKDGQKAEEVNFERGSADNITKIRSRQFNEEAPLYVNDQVGDSRSTRENGVKDVHFSNKAGNLDLSSQFADGADELECKTAKGWTPLHFAVRWRKKAAVEFLLDEPINPNILDNYGLPAVAYAVEFFDLSVFNAFLNCTRINISASFNTIGLTPLIHAMLCGRGNVATFLLYQKKLSVDADNYQSTLFGELQISPLHVAAYINNLNVTKILVDNLKVDVNSGVEVGWTPLQAAAPVSAVSSYLTKRDAKAAEVPLTKSHDIIQNFLENPENYKLLNSYVPRLEGIGRFDVDTIQDYIQTFVNQIYEL